MAEIRKPKVLQFTAHSRSKMRQYNLSEGRIRRVMHTPHRLEEGIAEGTVAMMQTAGNKTKPHEIWVMIQDSKDQRKVISAWRYPGTTKPGDPLPPEILREIKMLI